MSFKKLSIIASIAIVGGLATISASQAQYRYRAHVYHPYPAYNAQAYYAPRPNVLPPSYIFFDDNYSIYGCCGSTRNNERIGLVGAGSEAGR